MEDLEEDLDMDIDEDEEDEWEEDDDSLMAPVTPSKAASLTRSETPPIDPIMLSGYQITTSDFLPWIPPTQPSTYEVGGPSSAVPEAPYPVERLLSVVASRVALHHRDIGALCVRADKMKNMHIRALSLVRMVDGTLAEQGVLVASKLDETETLVLEMRDIVDNYPRGQVDALREEMDGLHGSTKTMSQKMQTLETALQEVRAQNQDLRTRLSASESR
ncbi:hypothetical protein Tco_1283351 [Tanacetum coccineum]